MSRSAPSTAGGVGLEQQLKGERGGAPALCLYAAWKELGAAMASPTEVLLGEPFVEPDQQRDVWKQARQAVCGGDAFDLSKEVTRRPRMTQPASPRWWMHRPQTGWPYTLSKKKKTSDRIVSLRRPMTAR